MAFSTYEGFDVKVLKPCKAEGRYQRGYGFNKGTRIKGRRPIMGDRMVGNEDAMYWLRVRR